MTFFRNRFGNELFSWKGHRSSQVQSVLKLVFSFWRRLFGLLLNEEFLFGRSVRLEGRTLCFGKPTLCLCYIFLLFDCMQQTLKHSSPRFTHPLTYHICLLFELIIEIVYSLMILGSSETFLSKWCFFCVLLRPKVPRSHWALLITKVGFTLKRHLFQHIWLSPIFEGILIRLFREELWRAIIPRYLKSSWSQTWLIRKLIWNISIAPFQKSPNFELLLSRHWVLIIEFNNRHLWAGCLVKRRKSGRLSRIS